MKTKHELIRFIQSLIRLKIHTVQVSSKDDQRALIKELDKQTKKGPVTVILVGE
jgi:pimeloyl-CoA synthetase